jgi:hypothetical protein
MKHRLAGALCKTQIQVQCPIRSASTASNAHGNGHAFNPRATICASIPSVAQGNGHALKHRATTGASIPIDAHGNGHALNLRATICVSIASDAQGNGHTLIIGKKALWIRPQIGRTKEWAIDHRRGGILTLFASGSDFSACNSDDLISCIMV